jgi:hypothetical protein
MKIDEKIWDRGKVARLRFLRQCKHYTSADPFLVIRKPETELFTTSFKAIRARIKKKSGIAETRTGSKICHGRMELQAYRSLQQ